MLNDYKGNKSRYFNIDVEPKHAQMSVKIFARKVKFLSGRLITTYD